MIIGIDLDDTLTCLLKTKIKTAKKYIKQNKLNVKLIKTDTHKFSEMFDWDLKTSEKFWWECSDNMLLKVKPRRSAKKILKKLSKDGHTLLIISARGKDAHLQPYELSLNWLTKNNIYFDGLFVEHLDKVPICQEKKVELFIDDQVTTLQNLQQVGIDTILMKTAHNLNKGYQGKEVNNWKQIYKIIKKYNIKQNKKTT